MKSIILLLVVFTTAVVAFPQFIPIVQRSEIRDEAGQYSLSYTGGDGTALTEHGALKRTPDGLDNVLVKQGSVSYVSPEGIPIHLTYTADENGFKPVGSHLPVSV